MRVATLNGFRGTEAALPETGVSGWAARSPFAFDLRAVGLFRILLALVILLDQFVRLGDWHAFQSAAGVLSLADSRTWGDSTLWSLYWLSDGPLLPVVLEALRFLATMTLLVGIRSRLSAFVLFVLLASVYARNPLLTQGGDGVLKVMTFFAVFLPLGESASLERLWFGKTPPRIYRSAATAAYAVQVLLVWFMAGILKTGGQWWDTGTAISMALHLEAFATEFARLWRGWDWLVQPMTFFVFWLECLAPLLLLVPSYWSRMVGLMALLALEVGIWLSLEVGLFPLICVVALLPLVPPRFVDLVIRWIPRRNRRGEDDLVLYYDQDCRFCAFACRLLLAVGAIRRARLAKAQSDPTAAAILEEHFAWCATWDAGASAGLDRDYRQGWEAVRFVIENSRRPWLLRVLPGEARGAVLYSWIGRNRGAIGSLGGICFGRKEGATRHGQAGRLVVSAALVVVLAWNLVSYPPMRDWRDYRGLVAPLVTTLNLDQYWSMFAPYPKSIDFYHVVPALDREGRRMHLLTGEPLDLAPPRDGPDHYGGYRWRKTFDRSTSRGEIERLLRYYCRTGRWAAIDIWVFERPNLGTAATLDGPYHVFRIGRWQCADVDQGTVDAFRADIDALMAPFLPPDAAEPGPTTPENATANRTGES